MSRRRRWVSTQETAAATILAYALGYTFGAWLTRRTPRNRWS